MFDLPKAFVLSVALHALVLVVILCAVSPPQWPGTRAGEKVFLVELAARQLPRVVPHADPAADKAVAAKKKDVQKKALPAKVKAKERPMIRQADALPAAGKADNREKTSAVKPLAASAPAHDKPLHSAMSTAAVEAPVDAIDAKEGVGSAVAEPASAGMERDGADDEAPLGAELIPLILSRIEAAKVYPRRAVRRGMEGAATIGFRIRPDGQVDDVLLLQSSGYDLLDRASIRAVKKAAPFPYVDVLLKVAVNFRLT